MTEPFREYCLCSHAREAHDIGVKAGKKIRTRCSHAACGCREHRPEEGESREVADEKPRGICPVCSRRFQLKVDGTVWPHGGDKSLQWPYRRGMCSGSGQRPSDG